MKCLLFAAVIFISSVNCFAHSGGTDKNGCHHNKKTGEYHCH
ncbi:MULTISPECIES: YHYH domain-containing protein [unclassified Methylophilus]|nr:MULTISPECIES: YHYH domain-containing protein [unclassified Methylophilus]